MWPLRQFRLAWAQKTDELKNHVQVTECNLVISFGVCGESDRSHSLL